MEEAPIEKPRFTVVIPTLNVARLIVDTLRSVSMQKDCDLEVLIIDAGSSDRTLNVAQRWGDIPVKVYSVADWNPIDMINRAASLAKGDYFSVLMPGDTWISPRTLVQVTETAKENGSPGLVYGGCLLREHHDEPKLLMRPLSRYSLSRGLEPTSLQACWFRREVFRRLGKLDSKLRYRAGYDLLCRLDKNPQVRSAMVNRVLVDHVSQFLSPGTLLQRAWETQAVLRKRYGFQAWLRWWLGIHPIQVIRLWWKTKKPLLLG